MAELTYSSAGVDVEAARKAMIMARRVLASTEGNKLAMTSGFFTGAMYLPADVKRMRRPILLANADGIGTLTHEAFNNQRFMERMGRSVVNHNMMDLAASGGVPAAFLDTLDWQKTNPELQVSLIKGMAQSCREVGAVILGGETASLPILVQVNEVVVNGAAIGFVDEKNLIDGTKRINPANVVIGIQSFGLLINGISLARRAVFEVGKLKADDIFPGTRRTVIDEMTKGTPNYAKYLLPVIAGYRKLINGIFNVTGDGIPGNLVRILPQNVEAVIYGRRLPKLPVFRFIGEQGVSRKEMWNTFNLGIGVGIVTSRKAAPLLLKVLSDALPHSFAPVVIGRIQKAERSQASVHLDDQM